MQVQLELVSRIHTTRLTSLVLYKSALSLLPAGCILVGNMLLYLYKSGHSLSADVIIKCEFMSKQTVTRDFFDDLSQFIGVLSETDCL